MDGFFLLIIDWFISDIGSESDDEIEDTSVLAEKISRLEAAQKKARIDIAVRGIKAKTKPKVPVRLSPVKKKVPKRNQKGINIVKKSPLGNFAYSRMKL